MNLVLRYTGVCIEKISAKKFKSILLGTDDIKLVKTVPTMLFLSDNTIIRCAAEYYRNPSISQKPKKLASHCFTSQKYLGVTGINVYSCAFCHLACIRLTETNNLTYK